MLLLVSSLLLVSMVRYMVLLSIELESSEHSCVEVIRQTMDASLMHEQSVMT